MGRDDPERAQINLWTEADRKARWKETVENGTEYSSLTQLIHVAVEKELSGDDPTVEVGETPSDERIDDVLETLTRIDKRLDRLDGEVRDVKASVDLAREDGLDELAQLVFEELPKDRLTAEGLTATATHDPDKPTGNPRELSERLNVPKSRIEAAIDQLETDMPGVISVYTDVATPRYPHYYTE